jgi:RNA polymerase sigma-70 factor (ECF subfamily)
MENAILSIRNNFDSHLSALVCKKVNHQDHCHDILQEVYIKVIQNIDKINKAENIKSYLLKIADNAVTDHYRKQGNKNNNEIPADLLTINEPEVNDNSLQLADCCLRPMIESLEPIYRDALIMIDLEGLTQKQYAEKACLSYTNAKTRVQRARQKLKEIILSCCTYEFDKYGNIISCKKNQTKCCCNQ